MTKRALIDPRSEFARARLGDRRLNLRLDKLVVAFERAPGQSIPKAMKSDAELEAAYRFFQNQRVTLDRLLEPHLEATAVRAASVKDVLVVHDTTEFRFGGAGKREGLGELANGGQGFFGHVALAVDAATRECLGVAGVVTYRREGDRSISLERVPIEERYLHDRESFRWSQLFVETEERLRHLVPIHVMDREADDFELLVQMSELGARFVVRSSIQRRRRGQDTDGVSGYLQDIVYSKPLAAEREVRLSPRANKRGGKSEKAHPTREGRLALLEVSAALVAVTPPRHHRRQPALPLGVIRVSERDPPDGQDPIEWILMTNEPIGTSEEILRVVDIYRARWTIEEYFKVLKTGCAIERRQLETVEALESVLALFLPIAARLLALRARARFAPHDRARSLLSEIELAALRVISRSPLPRYPSVADALQAIAAIGGHLKRNGDPGWLTLSRGFEDLHIAAQVATSLLDGRGKK